MQLSSQVTDKHVRADQYNSSQIAPYSKPTDAELLQIFPEMADVIKVKLAELYEIRKSLQSEIQDRSATIGASNLDAISKWFGLRWLDLNIGEELRLTEKDVGRLSRQLNLAEGRPLTPGSLTEEIIQKAREFPLTELVGSELRKRGKTIACSCPFHEERNPSFHIYIAQNRGWCFGCNQGGDVIDIAMRIHDFKFREAVLFLAGSVP